QRHVETILLEDAGLAGERERRKAGPARDSDGDLGIIRDGGGGNQEGGSCGEYPKATHDHLPLSVHGCSSVLAGIVLNSRAHLYSSQQPLKRATSLWDMPG